MATRKHSRTVAAMSCEDKAVARTAEERLLLLMFRGIESQHERNAVIILLQSIATGRLTSNADKLPLRALLRDAVAR